MRLPLGVLYFGGFMKRVVYFILAAAVLAGIIVAGCHKSGKQDDSDFESFEAQILDYNVWTTIHSPGVLGLDDIGVTLAIGSGDYANQQVYSGKVATPLSRKTAFRRQEPALCSSPLKKAIHVSTPRTPPATSCRTSSVLAQASTTPPREAGRTLRPVISMTGVVAVPLRKKSGATLPA